jgi:hypothetical protein
MKHMKLHENHDSLGVLGTLRFAFLSLKRAVEHADFEQSPVNIGFR